MYIFNVAKKGYLLLPAMYIFCRSEIALFSPKLDKLLQAMLK